MKVARWTVFEAAFEAASVPENPVQDLEAEAEFTAPSGKTAAVPMFWDGGRVWKARFSPDESGAWRYRTRVLSGSDPGLDGKTGTFRSVPYRGSNPLYRRGAVRNAASGTHFEQADGTPFFLLADTAWNGALLSSDADWRHYLADRAAKGFTAVQFVTTQWLSAGGNAEGRQAFSGRERIAVDPLFFRRLDGRIAALNRAGLLALPVLCWAATWNREALHLNPGAWLPEDQILRLARYQAARFGAYHAFCLLAGDGDYRGPLSEPWLRIGREAFRGGHGRPASLHPGGLMWNRGEFAAEPWFGFVAYQSGHTTKAEDLRWHVEGPPAADWRAEPVRPFVNLEPNYEAHRDWSTGRSFGGPEVRRAAYWSLLVHPPAGVAYGAHGLWSWEASRGVPMNHLNTGEAPPWRDALKLPGSACMAVLKKFFESLEWWTLRPAPGLLAEQPGRADPGRHTAAARSQDGTWALVYVPADGKIRLAPGHGLRFMRWMNPRTGRRLAAVALPSDRVDAPGAGDWLLWLGARDPSKRRGRGRTVS